MLKRLEVILKLTERCNIACTYCYYFENDEKSAFSRPSRLTDDAATKVAERIREAFDNQFCESVRIIFHGGEPLLIGKERFERLCRRLLKSGPAGKITLCMQTNAMLIDEEWINLFTEFNVSVGVSIDGPKEIHDRFRLDKAGRPTFDKTARGIHKLVISANQGFISPPGALVVIQPDSDPNAIFRLIVDEFGITNMDFLIPDGTWDITKPAGDIGEYLCTLFDCWSGSGRLNIYIRILKSSLSLLMGGPSFLGGFGPTNSTAVTILGNGDINGDDFLRTCGDFVVDLEMDLFNHSFEEAYKSNNLRLIDFSATTLPEDCLGCAFEKICCGGQLTHRFSREHLFRNKSIYCSELKMFYEHVCQFLLSSGMSPTHLENVLRMGAFQSLDQSIVFPDGDKLIAYSMLLSPSSLIT